MRLLESLAAGLLEGEADLWLDNEGGIDGEELCIILIALLFGRDEEFGNGNRPPTWPIPPPEFPAMLPPIPFPASPMPRLIIPLPPAMPLSIVSPPLPSDPRFDFDRTSCICSLWDDCLIESLSICVLSLVARVVPDGKSASKVENRRGRAERLVEARPW